MIEARDIVDKLGVTFEAVEAIEKIAKHVLNNETNDAFEAFHVVAVIIDALKAGLKGKLTIAEVQTEIKNLHQTLLVGDEAADTALEKKFDKGHV